jgi:hypothetical protein
MQTQREMIAEILRQVTEDEVAEDNGMMHDAKSKKLMQRVRGNAPMPKQDAELEMEEESGAGNGPDATTAKQYVARK